MQSAPEPELEHVITSQRSYFPSCVLKGGVDLCVDPGRVVLNLPNGDFMQRNAFSIDSHDSALQLGSTGRGLDPPSCGAPGMFTATCTTEQPALPSDASDTHAINPPLACPAPCSEDESDEDLLLPPLISPEECQQLSDGEPYDFRQGLLHEGLQDDDDTDSDEEPEGSFLSGPSVLRSFPWPPAPSTRPSEGTNTSTAHASGNVKRSGSIAKM